MWVALLVLAVLLFGSKRQKSRNIIIAWALTTALISPLVLYLIVSIPIIYIFSPRYTWWAMLMFALVIGAGLAYLPPAVWWLTQALVLGIMFLPVLNADFRANTYPMEPMFTWMQTHAQPGDAIVIDDDYSFDKLNWTPREDLQFAYYMRIFGHGLTVVEAPEDYRRIWYLSQDGDGWHDQALKQRIAANRVAREWFGPWNFLMRLYEAPPNIHGVAFENGLRFHGLEVIDGNLAVQAPINWMAQDTVRLRLWWSIDHPLDNEYSISVQILDSDRGKLIASQDGPPQLVQFDPASSSALPNSMPEWTVGQYYVEEREIALPDVRKQAYAGLYLTVYQWWDGVRLKGVGVNNDNLLPLQKVTIWGR